MATDPKWQVTSVTHVAITVHDRSPDTLPIEFSDLESNHTMKVRRYALAAIAFT